MRCEYCGQTIKYDRDRLLPMWVHADSTQRPCVERPGCNAWPKYDAISRALGPRSPWGSDGVLWQAELPGGGYAVDRAPDRDVAQHVIGAVRDGRTVCPNCGGAGSTRAVVGYAGSGGTGSVERPRGCETCEGRGWLVGVQPPV